MGIRSKIIALILAMFLGGHIAGSSTKVFIAHIANNLNVSGSQASQINHMPTVTSSVVLADVPVATPTPIPTDPVALGEQLAASYGWTGYEWSDLYALWNRESGWNPDATNRYSYAHGISQALPYSKTGCDWENAYCQIAWGLQYIKERYGDPANALYHENIYNWY